MKIHTIVTTSPRKVETLGRCVASLKDCGFDPVIYAEPGSYPLTEFPTTWNRKRRGAWHNFKYAVEDSMRFFSFTHLFYVQDDIVLHPDTKRFLEKLDFPEDCGMISAYCPSHYAVKGSRGDKPAGLHKMEVPTMYGACACLIPREIVQKMTESKTWDSWLGIRPATNAVVEFEKRKADPTLIKHIDAAISKLFNELSVFPYYIIPSLSQHIAEFSTLGHAPNTGRRRAGRIVNFHKPLEDQIQI